MSKSPSRDRGTLTNASDFKDVQRFSDTSSDDDLIAPKIVNMNQKLS